LVIEVGGIGPGQFGVMLLADLGAEVIRVEDPRRKRMPQSRALLRGRKSIVLNLKQRSCREALLRLVTQADVLVEAFRPGVAERLGVGPDQCRERNPRLVYARMTGWGQEGPLAGRAGHDINYLAVSGVLDRIGRAGAPPTPPLNVVGDYGGGGMLLAIGVLAALLARERTGQGQVVDAAILDGSALFLAPTLEALARGELHERGANRLDSGAPYYDCYQTADGRYLAVGCGEQQFYNAFVDGLGIDHKMLPDREDRTTWPALRAVFSAALRTRTRAEWEEVFSNVDACVTPVLHADEVARFEHNRARSLFFDSAGMLQPNAAPRLSATPAIARRQIPEWGANTFETLANLGYSTAEIAHMTDHRATVASEGLAPGQDIDTSPHDE
jgi:alpha-methylacyl-CoA racemase